MTTDTQSSQAAQAGNPITIRLELENRAGMIGKVTSTIGTSGGNIGAIDLVQMGPHKVIRDITFTTSTDVERQAVLKAVRHLDGIRVISASDPLLLYHLGGKIAISLKKPVTNRQELSMAYTPGVGRVCMHIYHNPESVWNLTIKRNCVAVVTDGTAVLGLGDIGPQAAMPVMEGKALLFKEFGGVDAWPICLDTKDVDAIVNTVKYLAPVFGAVNLEDISAPRCFEIEDRLKAELDIPVMHDDQHATAVVTAAGLINALKLVKKHTDELKVIVAGVGASGVATSKIILNMGVKNLIGFDTLGAVYEGRVENMNSMKEWFAQNTNFTRFKGSLSEAMEGADLFIGLSGPGVITAEDVKKMNRDPIVFAMANPDPEIMPWEAAPYARIIATGRSDFANQINNALAFPGIFRGALDVQASEINEEMKMAAAQALADTISSRELQEDYIIPSIFNRNVAPAIAKTVARAARATGVAGRKSTRHF